MEAGARERFCGGLEALLRRLHPDGAGLDLAAAMAEFAATLTVAFDPQHHDLEDRSEGSLTSTDALRIRATKFLVAHLPPGLFADPVVRRTVRAEIRALAAEATGSAARSRYLDGALED